MREKPSQCLNPQLKTHHQKTMLSRVADSLYWMSRYLERAECTARVVDVHLNLMLDQGQYSGSDLQTLLIAGLNARLPEDKPLEDPNALARYLTFEADNSIVNCIASARENARQIREQISTEMYEKLNRLYLQVRAPDIMEQWAEQPHEFYVDVKEAMHLIHGVTEETFAHGEAFLFIKVGKSLERASSTANLLRVHAPSLTAGGSTESSYLEWVALLRGCTSFEAYCRQYTADLRPKRVVEFLLLDEETPRSVRFCADLIEDSLEGIATVTGRRKDTKLLREAGKLRSMLHYSSVDEIMAGDLPAFLSEVRAQCGQIHGALFGTYIGYTVETAMVA